MRAKPHHVLVCQSAAMRELGAAIEKAAETDDPVLVVGEPGSGRELCARLVHNQGRRHGCPLVTVRPGAAPRAIAVDELDGGSMDAFERARSGTLLVKDVGELSRTAQRRLSRALADNAATGGRHDARIIATSDPGLERAAEARMFNRALFVRLSVWTLRVPPLRERPEDIAPLADRLLNQYTRELGRGRLVLGSPAIERLASHGWPGNVAELKAAARRLAVGVRGGTVRRADVDAVLPALPASLAPDERSLEELVRAKLDEFLRRVEGYALTGVHEDVMTQVERPLIALVLERAGGNQVRAAEILGLSRNTLRKKLGDHGLTERRGVPAPRARSRPG
jgi:two-component system, NtrC family, nitrogen regulation response regulator GlnG